MKAQEYLDLHYPKEKRKDIVKLDIRRRDLTGSLNLSDFINLKYLDCSYNQLTDLDLTNCINLKYLDCSYKNLLTTLDVSNSLNLTDLSCSCQLTNLNLGANTSLAMLECNSNQLTNVNFLTTLINPEKLEWIRLFNNNIQPTDIEIFSRFVNLECLKIGTMEDYLGRGQRNKFYGSLESWRNLSKLTQICIEVTDINSGLEYLPSSLAQSTEMFHYSMFECSSRNTNARCSTIQDELRPFNYDVEAWQLAHPEKMFVSHPEYFTQWDDREKWIKALSKKIEQTKQELEKVKSSESDKIKKIERLEQKLQRLIQTNDLLEKPTQTETITTADKEIQTELTSKQIERLLEIEQQTQVLTNLVNKS